MKRNHRPRRPARNRKPANMRPIGWATIIFMAGAVWLRMVAINPRLMEIFR